MIGSRWSACFRWLIGAEKPGRLSASAGGTGRELDRLRQILRVDVIHLDLSIGHRRGKEVVVYAHRFWVPNPPGYGGSAWVSDAIDEGSDA